MSGNAPLEKTGSTRPKPSAVVILLAIIAAALVIVAGFFVYGYLRAFVFI